MIFMPTRLHSDDLPISVTWENAMTTNPMKLYALEIIV